MQQKPLELEYNNAPHRESNAESALHEDLMIFTIESIMDLGPRYYSFQ